MRRHLKATEGQYPARIYKNNKYSLFNILLVFSNPVLYIYYLNHYFDYIFTHFGHIDQKTMYFINILHSFPAIYVILPQLIPQIFSFLFR